ncbi:hypothetical protein GQ42DRAFT_24183 [Ramicandelaber brevisporus]|nr:hypothetical protein GQ42DRAFT_24183 [Ramicandelaber brevisporus]
MKHTANGYLTKQGDYLTGHFTNEFGSVIATVKLSTPVKKPITAPMAIIEYEDIKDLEGELMIEPGSTVGPKQLNLLLKNVESDTKVTITGKLNMLVPKPVREFSGTGLFHLRQFVTLQ